MISRRSKPLFLFAISLSLIPGFRALAAEPAAPAAGMVAFMQGKAEVNGTQARQGLALSEGDLIEVGAGRLTVILDRDRVMHLGENTKVKLEELRADVQADVKLEYGAVRSLVKSNSGKARPFRVRTPSAVMGVRGTQFYVDLPQAGALTGEGLKVATLEGSVAVWSGQTSIDAPPKPLMVSSGQLIVVAAQNTAVAVGGKPVNQIPVQQMKEGDIKQVRESTQVASRPVPGSQGPLGPPPPPRPPGFGNAMGPGQFQGFLPPMRVDLTID